MVIKPQIRSENANGISGRGTDPEETLKSVLAKNRTDEQTTLVWGAALHNGNYPYEDYEDFLRGMKAGPTRDAFLVKLAHSAGKAGNLKFLAFIDQWSLGSSRTNAIEEFSSQIRGIYLVSQLLEWSAMSEIPSDSKTVFQSVGPGVNALEMAELVSLGHNQRIGETGRALVAFAIGNRVGASGENLTEIRASISLDFSDEEWTNAENIYWRRFPMTYPDRTLDALERGEVPAKFRTETAMQLFNGYCLAEGYEAAFVKTGNLSSEKLRKQVISHVSKQWARNDLNEISQFSLKLWESGKSVPAPMVDEIVKRFIDIGDIEGAESWKSILPDSSEHEK